MGSKACGTVRLVFEDRPTKKFGAKKRTSGDNIGAVPIKKRLVFLRTQPFRLSRFALAGRGFV
jgi:hypothetical protein